MKKTLNLWIGILFGLGFLWASCQSGPEDDPAPDNNNEKDTTEVVDDDPPPPTGTQTPEPNELTDRFIIENASKIQGVIPSSAPLSDLKIDKETLYFVEGIKNRIRILYPGGIYKGVSHIYLQVEGAEEYFDIEPEEEESSDTVGVLYLEFDPEDLSELPLSFDVKIVPHDDGGTPIDPIEIEVVVEEKQADPCSHTGTQGEGNWFWLWTTIDANFYSAPGRPVGTEATTNGCCLEGQSVDCIANAIEEKDWISLKYAAYLMTNLEYVSFKDDGTFLGSLIEQTQNLDYSESDFCSGVPEYVRSTTHNTFWGEYMYEPSNSQLFITNVETTPHEICFEELGICDYYYDKTYIRPDSHYEILSCHFLIETSSIEGMIVHRLFERREGEVNDAAEWAYWFD